MSFSLKTNQVIALSTFNERPIPVPASIRSTKLDKDEKARIEELGKKWNEHQQFDVSEVFRYRQIPKILSKENVLLPSFDAQRSILSLPFHSNVLAYVCPKCTKDFDELEPLMETGSFIPILIGNYSHYTKKFVSRILTYPHISRNEYSLFRFCSIQTQADKIVCGHCVELIQEKATNLLEKSSAPELYRTTTKSFFSDLSPYLGPDKELIELYLTAIEKRQGRQLLRLRELSSLINQLRSAQLFQAAPSITLEELEKVAPLVRQHTDVSENAADLPYLREVVASGLGLLMPSNMKPQKYLEVVLPFKEQLRSVTSSLVRESSDNGKPSIAKLYALISEVNEEIRRAEQSTRSKMLKASVGLVKANPFLVGSVLIGGAFGICGSMLGCGATIATGAAAKTAAKLTKLKFDESSQELAVAMRRNLRQKLRKRSVKHHWFGSDKYHSSESYDSYQR